MLVQDPITGNWFPISSVPVPGTERLTVTIQIDVAHPLPSRESEKVAAVEQVYRIAAAMVSTQSLTGTVSDRNGLTTGHWTYTPTAAS